MNVFELMAKINLDTSGYTKSLSGAKEAAKGAAKVGAAAFAAIGTATVAAGVAVVKETGNIAAYGDSIDKMSQKMGISAKAYQEWDAVLQHSGASIGSLLPSMKTLSMQAQKGAEEFQLLGISEEEVANLSKEDLFARTIEGLQQMEEGTERTTIASKLLGRGATELGALLNTSAEDTQKMRDRVNELGGVMSDKAVKAAAAYQDQLQDMQTAIQGVKRNILSDLLPAMTAAMSGITEIAAGNYSEGVDKFGESVTEVVNKIGDILPKILTAIPTILSKVGQSLLSNIKVIIPFVAKTITQLVATIADLLPTLVDVAAELATAAIGAITEAVPILLAAIPSIIKSLLSGITTIFTALPQLVDMIHTVIETVSEMLIDVAPILIEGALTLYEKVLDYITTPEVLAKLVVMVARVTANLTAALLASVPKLLVGVGKIYAAIFDNIVSTDWTNVGSQLMTNITAALQNASNKLMVWWDGWSDQIGKYAVIAFNAVVSTWSNVGQWFADRWADIKRPFSQVADFFKTIFSNAWTAIKNVFSPVGATFNSIGNSILNGIKSIVNGLIRGINNIITVPFNGLNSALRGIRGIDVLGSKPFSWLSEITVPQIPQLAQGGVLRRGQIALLEGQGDEAVIPLSQNTEWIDKVSKGIEKNLGAAKYEITINIGEVNNTSDKDIQELAREIGYQLQIELENRRAAFA